MEMIATIHEVAEGEPCLLLMSTVGHDVAYGMTWKTLKKMMTDKYCPRSEIKKLEIEIWNLKVKDTDVCAPECNNCKKVGHMARDCRSPAANVNANSQRNSGAIQRVVTFFRCGVQGNYKKDYPKLKNKNRGNQAGNGGAQARAYAVGSAGTNLDSNLITGTFLLNNRYASILFDTCADRSFVSTAFSSLIDIVLTTLDHDYDVELADEFFLELILLYVVAL
ncbi:putative reverse transcriptase domain-containing protein [Tanacetum coccineum]|uniref:Reverse transcriptase domain-containing protein n=1 Tax=Tanacetum coccineum TaxID=301880 RepID=A0ABQ5HCE4_9ASTR